MKENQSLKIKALVDVIVKGMQEKKAENITVIDLREIDNAVCDFFVISNANSNTQVNAIVSSIQKKVSKNTKDKPWHIEGSENSEWVLMDYVHVVVHVFQKHIREYYDIENLWGDAKITEIETSY